MNNYEAYDKISKSKSGKKCHNVNLPSHVEHYLLA